MSEYTKTPWHVELGEAIYICSEETQCDVTTVVNFDHSEENEANARHIVHCVNSHERLVEALEECRDAMEGFNRAPGATRDEWEFECEVKEIDELLAQLQADKGVSDE